jgi:hypothetical protein
MGAFSRPASMAARMRAQNASFIARWLGPPIVRYGWISSSDWISSSLLISSFGVGGEGRRFSGPHVATVAANCNGSLDELRSRPLMEEEGHPTQVALSTEKKNRVAHNKIHPRASRYFSKCETLKASVRFAAALCEISGSFLIFTSTRRASGTALNGPRLAFGCRGPKPPVPQPPVGVTAAHLIERCP